jgi:trehalose 6-phosphate phosphatase
MPPPDGFEVTSEVDAELRLDGLALLLDVDGTLLEIAPTPGEVVVDEEIIGLLRALSIRTGGALALVSGRSIANLDALFEPLLLPAAGLHGFERRSAAGEYHRRALPPGELLSQGRESLSALCDAHPALLMEDKRFAIAVHYRQAPQLERAVLSTVARTAVELGPEFVMQRGRCVAELRPADARKGAAVADFMCEPPFAGRRPVFIGDDITDESAFDYVNTVAGLSIAVGVSHPTLARGRLSSVKAARAWLRQLLEQPD